jgi:hypothetical protein
LSARAHFLLITSGLIALFCFPDQILAQKVVWARQIGAPSASARVMALEAVGETGVTIGIRADKTLNAGKASLPFGDENEIRTFRISSGGGLEEGGIATQSDSSHHSGSLHTKSRNGNSYLAYARSSAMVLPQNPEWNLAFLDGNNNRLWDISLPKAVIPNQIQLLADGNCLVAGSEKAEGKMKDIWFAIYAYDGKELLSRKLGGKSDDEVLTAAQDNKGRLYIAGYCSPDSSFLGNARDLSGSDKDGFIACFDAAGNEKFFYRQRGQGLCRTEKIVCLPDGQLLFASSLSGKDWKLPPFGFPKIGKEDIVIGLIDPATGKEKENPIRIFPNPAKEAVYFGLQSPEFSGKAKARLHKKDGTILQEMDIRPEPGLSYRFNVANTTPGAYFISIRSGKKELSERLVVE